MKNISYLCTRVYGVKHPASALVAELVDAPDLGSGGSGRVGSSPIRRTQESRNPHFMGVFGTFSGKKGKNCHKMHVFLKKT